MTGVRQQKGSGDSRAGAGVNVSSVGRETMCGAAFTTSSHAQPEEQRELAPTAEG
ncbi:MAG: hypothetical protein JWN14_4793 [Chthonomonadales bacterium]|nr:hypothetical protein [Chthonomonadales bacterium]